MQINNIKILVTGLCLYLFFVGCKFKSSPQHEAEPAHTVVSEQTTSPTNENADIYKLDNGLIIKVYDKRIEVTTQTGKKYVNKNIIRRMDENANCPSEGFMNVVHKNDFFTIEQQNCSNWLLINEYITFKYKEEDNIHLHKFGLQYIDRRDPEKSIPEKIISQKDLGMRPFEQVKLNDLYILTRQ